MEKDILKNSWKNQGTLHIQATNLKEFNKLIEKINDKNQELQKLINDLQHFNIKISFSDLSD